jgi:hypothetical protein
MVPPVHLRLRLTLVAVVLAATSCAGSANRGPRQPGPAGAVARPALSIDEREEPFVDTSRSTDAVGTTPASASRSLPTRITAPAAGQHGRPYPLIVFAHGNGG